MSEEVEKLKRALLKVERKDYEELRKEIIAKQGYSKFRDIQKEAFLKL